MRDRNFLCSLYSVKKECTTTEEEEWPKAPANKLRLSSGENRRQT